MTTSTAQDEAFLKSVVSRTLLEDSIAWIQDNMEPVDVFTDDQLREWALDNGFTEE